MKSLFWKYFLLTESLFQNHPKLSRIILMLHKLLGVQKEKCKGAEKKNTQK